MSHPRQSTAQTTCPRRRYTEIRNLLILLRLTDVFQEQWNSIACFATCSSFSTILPPPTLGKGITQLHSQKERLHRQQLLKVHWVEPVQQLSRRMQITLSLKSNLCQHLQVTTCPLEKLSDRDTSILGKQFPHEDGLEMEWDSVTSSSQTQNQRGLCCKSTGSQTNPIHIPLQYIITSTPPSSNIVLFIHLYTWRLIQPFLRPLMI